MAQYSVDFPNGLQLTVTLSEHPVHMRVTFPSGSEVHFDHSPKSGEKSVNRIDVDPSLKKEKLADGRWHVTDPSNARDGDDGVKYKGPDM